MSEIKILGHKFSKGEAVAVGAGGLVVIYFVWKQHKASTPGSAASIDPVTGLPTSEDDQIDPLTGSAYLAEAQQYGSVSAAEQAYAGEASVDYGSSYSGGGGVAGSSATPLVYANEVQGTTYASNAAWSQAVEAGLSDIGYSSTDIAAALGRYLGSLSETPDQASIVDAAIAEYGDPPVGTFTVIMAPATTSTTSGNTGTGTSTDTGTTTTTTGSGSGGTTSTGGGSTSTGSSGSATSNPVSANPAPATSSTSGGHVVSVNNNDAVIAWTPHGPAKQWRTTIVGPGPINGHTSVDGVPQATYSGLSAGHNYEVTVQPLPTGTSGVIHILTTDVK